MNHRDLKAAPEGLHSGPLSFGVIFLAIFTVVAGIGYLFLLQFPRPAACLSALLAVPVLLTGLLVEALGCFIIYVIASKIHRIGIFIGYLAVMPFAAANLVQLGSLYYSSTLLPRLAIENIEFVGLMLTPTNIIAGGIMVAGFLLVPLLISLFINRRLGDKVGRLISDTPLRTAVSAALVMVFFCTSELWLPRSIRVHEGIYLAQNGMEKFYPSWTLFKTLVGIDETGSRKSAHLDGKDAERLRQLFGFNVNPLHRYPLVKRWIYRGSCPFRRSSPTRPNVILIFTEGTSARTLSVYNTKFKGVTPNLKRFAANSTVIYNYFNHTTATYRGLLGQSCSFYPRFGGLGGWYDNYENLPHTSYFCLSDLFKGLGYDVIFMGAETRNAAHTHDMMRILGFHVLTAEDLKKLYLRGEGFRATWGLSDQQMYQALVGFLKERARRPHARPFFLAMYTEGTHAWQDVGSDGVKYGDGSSNTLNTLHNLDDAFGKFWSYYQGSPFARDTVVIFTVDHAHFQEKSYVSLMRRMHEQDYRPVFVDRIPLLIHDPTVMLPATIDAHGATSVDLTPTLAQLLCLPNQNNPFLGRSILNGKDGDHWPLGLTWYDPQLFVIDEKGVHGAWSKDEKYKRARKIGKRFIRYLHRIERMDLIWPERHPERWMSSKQRVLYEAFSGVGMVDAWPADGSKLRFNQFKKLPGLILFEWRIPDKAVRYELSVTLSSANGTSKSWNIPLKANDTKLLIDPGRGIAGTYFILSTSNTWNSLVPYEARWRVKAIAKNGDTIWSSQERRFYFEAATHK